ncbi:MAG: hypothetical protein LBQ88_06615 [Treponema sp.]|jgi:hypothetical protein|nr:hypothetical protein [Treponema sp.]
MSSLLERKMDKLIEFLNTIPPSLINITGGEVGLSPDFINVIESLPQHKWWVTSNGSVIPEWFYHKNVILFELTLHHEFTTPEIFMRQCKKLLDHSKRVITKLLVKQSQELESISVFSKFWNSGIPMHLTPVIPTHYYTSAFIIELINKYRTSCIYNADFFRPLNIVKKSRNCAAGTRQYFYVFHDGTIRRCRSNFEQINGSSTISNPVFYEKPKICDDSLDCYCEFMPDLSLANENERWNRYMETGNWEMPSKEDLYTFIQKMNWDLAGYVYDNNKRLNLFDDNVLKKIYAFCQVPNKSENQILNINNSTSTFWTELPVNPGEYTYFGAKSYFAGQFFNIPELSIRVLKIDVFFEFEKSETNYYCIVQNGDYEPLYAFVGSGKEKKYSIFITRNAGKIRFVLFPATNAWGGGTMLNFTPPQKILVSSEISNYPIKEAGRENKISFGNKMNISTLFQKLKKVLGGFG